MLNARSIDSGTIIGDDYEVICPLGEGNMSTVYKARQISLNRPVALKVLFNNPDESENFTDIFFHEVRTAALLVHPNLVHAINAGIHEGLLFFVMEYVDGQTLREMLDEGTLPDLAHIIKIMADIAMALDYATKKHSLSHGDIKPDNIIVKSDGTAKLADFGLAQTKEDSRETTGIFVTPLYASPESIQGIAKPGDTQPDIYSFGCTLFELITGTTPFSALTTEQVCSMHLNNPPPKLEDKIEGLPPELYKLVNQTLVKDPLKRPRNWHIIAQRLYSLLEGNKSYKEERKTLYIDHTIEHNKAVASAIHRYKQPKRASQSLFLMILVAILTTAGVGLAIYNRTYILSNVSYIKLKSKVTEYSSPESACTHIRNYLKHYGEDAVPAAKELLKEYEEKAQKSKKD